MLNLILERSTMEISFKLCCAILAVFIRVFIINLCTTLLYHIHIYMYNFYPNK